MDSSSQSVSTANISVAQLLRTINKISEQLEDILQRWYKQVLFDNGYPIEYCPKVSVIDSEVLDFELRKDLATSLYTLFNGSLETSLGILGIDINDEKIKRKEENEEKTAEHRVFEEVHLHSKGNPGVALRVWDLGLDYPHIAPKNIGQFSYDIILEYEEAFVLSLILSYQGLKKSELADMIGSMSRVDKIFFRFLNQELIFEDEENFFRIRPEALCSVIAYLKKLRLVW
jgi:hypothetical protein